MWQLHVSKLCYNDAQRIFIIEQQRETLNNQNPNPGRWNTKSLWAPLELVGHPIYRGSNLVI